MSETKAPKAPNAPRPPEERLIDDVSRLIDVLERGLGKIAQPLQALARGGMEKDAVATEPPDERPLAAAIGPLLCRIARDLGMGVDIPKGPGAIEVLVERLVVAVPRVLSDRAVVALYRDRLWRACEALAALDPAQAHLLLQQHLGEEEAELLAPLPATDEMGAVELMGRLREAVRALPLRDDRKGGSE